MGTRSHKDTLLGIQRSIERTNRTESQASKNKRVDRGWLVVFVEIDSPVCRLKRT